MEDIGVRYNAVDYGFEFGAAHVYPATSDSKKGWVYLVVDTPRARLTIYVTKTGKIRVFDKKSKELK